MYVWPKKESQVFFILLGTIVSNSTRENVLIKIFIYFDLRLSPQPKYMRIWMKGGDYYFNLHGNQYL